MFKCYKKTPTHARARMRARTHAKFFDYVLFTDQVIFYESWTVKYNMHY